MRRDNLYIKELSYQAFVVEIDGGPSVVGLIPSANGSLVVNPLVPAEALPWWAADGMVLHGRVVSVLFDADGKKYGKGAGLKVWLDGKVVAQAETMRKLTVQL